MPLHKHTTQTFSKTPATKTGQAGTYLRVPVLRGNRQAELSGLYQSTNYTNDTFLLCRNRAPRKEVVLKVHDDQCAFTHALCARADRPWTYKQRKSEVKMRICAGG